LAEAWLTWYELTRASLGCSQIQRNVDACWLVEISTTAAMMLTGNGKVLVPKQWGVGYQKFNGNKHDKNVKIHMKINTKKKLKLIKIIKLSKSKNNINSVKNIHKICPLHEQHLNF